MSRPRIRPSSDIRPLSEFRANMASFVDQVQDSGRPLVLTQNGRGAAVLISVDEFESIYDELDLLRDIRVAEDQIASGEGISNTKAKAELKRRLR